jgi:hypothetical protein
MVLLIIADHASDDGTEAWPSQATIATKASISIRTVQRAVNSLVAAGYLWMEKGAGGSANCREDRRPHRYTINIKRLRGDTESTREERSDIDDINGATLTTPTGRQSRPMNHPNKPSNETSDGRITGTITAKNEFELFWKIYPRKEAKQAAKKAWDKALKVAHFAEIITGARRYANDPNRVDAFTAHAATWLNAHRWNDSPLPPRVLTADEKKARELEESKAKTERERQEYLKWQQEIREAEARSVPPPADIVEFLRKTLPKR